MGSSVAQAESSSSSPNFKYNYDVFLSFRGDDTRYNFTSHLRTALGQKGVNFFIDDNLDRGGQISESLLKSIEGSRISIIVFSQNYASSTWCLDELVKIIECMKYNGQIVLPVFYKVDTSEVRKQTGRFGEALAEHEAQFMTKIHTWKEALTTAVDLSGWDLKVWKDEAKLIENLVKEVLSILNCMQLLHVAKHPVGIDSQLRAMELTSDVLVSNNVHMAGKYGMEGIESWSSSPNFKWSYDVFLSFRGEDTRSNFISHLEITLRQKGINSFRDNNLVMGSSIAESLFKSIEGSRISIVVFSKNYASSAWCLDELVKIIECMKSKGQIVVPVFYKVHPSDVRKQTGRFGEALAKHESKFMTTKIQTWKEALTTAADLSGWDLQTRHEADLVQDVVEDVLAIVNRRQLHVPKHPVGIDSQLGVMKLASHGVSNDVYMVGLYGIGGIGKTTLAKALFNKISNQFEGRSFLSNVRETSKQCNGLVQLQEKLLYEILKVDLKVGSSDQGKNIIRDRLCSKKVLILVDDVDEHQQLEALVGGRDWFGKGSNIIVTTRNKGLLSIHEFDDMHAIQGLDHDEALELFSWYVFKEKCPSSNYLDLSERMVGYCKGLPLAVVLLGSFLHKRPRSVWKSKLDELEISLEKGVQDIFQISFEGLEDRVKEVFLDISCFFVGEDVDCMKNMLKARDLNSDYGITVLTGLSLITIEDGKVQMHDLIRKMGQTIVRGESFELEKRSRLWVANEIINFLKENPGTDAVKAMKLDLSFGLPVLIDAQAFRNMKNLRLLILRNITFSSNIFEYLLNKLKWIFSRFGIRFPSSPASYFVKDRLVGLDMQRSFIKHLGNSFENCKGLKHVDLSYCELLEEIPDLSAALNLETLYLRGCISLKTIHESVVSLSKLITLDLEGCVNLEKLPSYLRLKSLDSFHLSGCCKLQQLPEFDENMKSLTRMVLDYTAIKELPSSIGYLGNLEILTLKGCANLIALPSAIHLLQSLMQLRLPGCSRLEMFAKPNSQPIFSPPNTMGTSSNWESPHLVVPNESLCSKLTILDLKNCNISNADFLEALSNVSTSLTQLHLSGNKFFILPSCLHNFSSLRELQLKNCKFLLEIPNLPHSIQTMDARGCELLVRSPDNIADIIYINQDKFDGSETREFILMNNKIPNWFSHRTTTSSVTVSIQHYPEKGGVLAGCVVFKVDGDSYCEAKASIKYTVLIDGEPSNYFEITDCPSSKSEYMWLVATPLTFSGNPWHEINVSCKVYKVCNNAMVTIRSLGVHFDLMEERQSR